MRIVKTLPPQRAALAAALAVLLLAAAPATPALTAAAPSEPTAARSQAPQSSDDIDPVIREEMLRQSATGPAQRVIMAEQLTTPQSGFASLAYSDGGLILYWKGELTSGMRAALTQARRWCSVAVKPAAHSDAELKAAGRKIWNATRDRRTGIHSIGYMADGSGLEVARIPPDESARSAGDSRATEPITPLARLVQEAGVTVPVTIVDITEPIGLLAYTQEATLTDSPEATSTDSTEATSTDAADQHNP